MYLNIIVMLVLGVDLLFYILTKYDCTKFERNCWIPAFYAANLICTFCSDFQVFFESLQIEYTTPSMSLTLNV